MTLSAALLLSVASVATAVVHARSTSRSTAVRLDGDPAPMETTADESPAATADEPTTTTTTAVREPTPTTAMAAAAGPKSVAAAAPPPPVSVCRPDEVEVTLEQNKRPGAYAPGDLVGLIAKAKNVSGHPCHYPADVRYGVLDAENTALWGGGEDLRLPDADAGPAATAWEPGAIVFRYAEWDQRQCPRQENCGTQVPPGHYTAKVAFHSAPSAAENYAYGVGVRSSTCAPET